MLVLRIKRLVSGVVILLVIGLLAAVSWLVGSRESMADNNTMQVTKPMVADITPLAAPDFFTEYRLERDKIRSERSEVLRESLKIAQNEDARRKAQEAVLKMVIEKQQEAEAEGLIKAMGYSDALVFLRDNSVSVVVKSAAIGRDEVLKIADVINKVTGVAPEGITISTKP